MGFPDPAVDFSEGEQADGNKYAPLSPDHQLTLKKNTEAGK